MTRGRAGRIARVVLATIALLAGPARPEPFAWPHGERAAVSLSYDDALDSQLDVALPALDRAGLRGTFYLTLASPTLARRLADWRAAAARGHELGNHTLFHQCSRTAPGHDWVTPEVDLDTTSADRLVAQVRLGNTMLQAIDGRVARTFTVPCGDVRAAGEDYVARLRGDFVAIKLGAGGVVRDMAALDPWAVPVETPSDATGEQLIAIVERAARAGTMANLTFHGVGGDYLAVPAAAHEALLRHLAAHRDVYWTAPFIDIMRYVQAHRAPGDGDAADLANTRGP